VPSRQDLEGFRAPELRERVRLLVDLRPYVGNWELALSAGAKPSPQQATQLNERARELQTRAAGVGFGGLAHHIAEFIRLLGANSDLASLRAQLSIVSELQSQARQVLTAEEADQLAQATRLPAPGNDGPQSLAPPPLITVMRPMDAAVAAALKAVQEAQSQSWPGLEKAPSPPAAWQPPTSPRPVPPAPAQSPAPAAPQFAVKNMLGLRGFNKGAGPARAGSQPAASLLGLPVPGQAAPGRANGPGWSAPPPFVAPSASGLPSLAPDASVKRPSGSRESDEIRQRLPERASSQPAERVTPSPRATPLGRPALRGRRAPKAAANGALWAGVAGAVVLVSVGLVAFFALGRRSPPVAPGTGPSGRTDALASAAPGSASPQSANPPALTTLSQDTRFVTDDERFTALLAQIHGHGGKESPELRSLLNDQAALASKALSGKCTDNSPACKEWADVHDLMVGPVQPIVKRHRSGDAETTRSQWMMGLKMPGIAVEDDPRVQRKFDYYTENPEGRETFQQMLFRCGAYRDLILSTLIRYGLPEDLMAIVFTESGCEPSAKSPVGAAGLWQFMPETGRAYHLRVVENTIDERYSPFKSTDAGIRMLADLRQKLGSWDLVFASYNMGPFGILALVEKAGGDATFWDLVDAHLLPDETADYSPTVEAIALILANLQRLRFTGSQIRAPQLTADLDVPGGTRLGVVARAAATSVVQLHGLNLDFSGDVVPLIPNTPIAVQVPKDVVWQARDALKDLLISKDGSDQCVSPTFDWGKQRFTPEMDAACKRRLAAGLGAASPGTD